jgi:hypothetical protein
MEIHKIVLILMHSQIRLVNILIKIFWFKLIIYFLVTLSIVYNVIYIVYRFFIFLFKLNGQVQFSSYLLIFPILRILPFWIMDILCHFLNVRRWVQAHYSGIKLILLSIGLGIYNPIFLNLIQIRSNTIFMSKHFILNIITQCHRYFITFIHQMRTSQNIILISRMLKRWS